MVPARVLLVLLAAFTLALAALRPFGLPAASAQGPSVSVDSLSASVGVPAKVELRANDIASPGLGAWTVDVHYDPSLVTVLDCSAAQGGLCNAHYNATTLRVSGTNVYGLPGNVDLASIGLACAAAGTGTLEVAIDVLADATVGNPQPIDAAVENGSVTCTSESTPTPTEQPSPTATPPASQQKLPGDADCNGTVDSIDAAIILQYSANIIASIPCLNNADFNHDGVVNAVDAALTLQTSAGLL